MSDSFKLDLSEKPKNFEKFGRAVWNELSTLRLSSAQSAEKSALVAVQCGLSQAGRERPQSDAEFNKWADSVGL